MKSEEQEGKRMEIVCTAILNKPLFTRLPFPKTCNPRGQGGFDPRLGIGGLGATENSKP